MGLKKLIRATKRIKELKEEISKAQANDIDTLPLMRKRIYIAKELYTEVHRMQAREPVVMAFVQSIGGMKISQIDRLYASIVAESKQYGIELEGVEGVGRG